MNERWRYNYGRLSVGYIIDIKGKKYYHRGDAAEVTGAVYCHVPIDVALMSSWGQLLSLIRNI